MLNAESAGRGKALRPETSGRGTQATRQEVGARPLGEPPQVLRDVVRQSGAQNSGHALAALAGPPDEQLGSYSTRALQGWSSVGSKSRQNGQEALA